MKPDLENILKSIADETSDDLLTVLALLAIAERLETIAEHLGEISDAVQEEVFGK